MPTWRRRRSTDSAGPRLFAGDPTVKRLTPREREVALLIAQELTDYAIAKRLDLSLGAIKVYRQRIQRRLQLANRAEIVAWVTARISDANPDRLHRVGDRIGTGTDSTEPAARSDLSVP